MLNNRSDKETIVSIYPYSNRPEDVKRLLDLIDYHYGFDLFRSIDAAKKDLSKNFRATVEFYPLELSEQITVTEFEQIIGATALKIENEILDVLRKAAVEPQEIGRVILTGGSSQVPLLNRAVVKMFGEEKILRPDYFASVATGLGYVAARLND